MEENKESDLVLESLRINLKRVQEDKMELESKEIEIKKEIEKRIQGE